MIKTTGKTMKRVIPTVTATTTSKLQMFLLKLMVMILHYWCVLGIQDEDGKSGGAQRRDRGARESAEGVPPQI